MSDKIAVIDYGVANLESIRKFLTRLELNIDTITNYEDLLCSKAEVLLIPGVGSFDQGMRNLQSTKLDSGIKEWSAESKKIIGVCLGMQLMASSSQEGSIKGLNLLPSTVVKISKKAKKIEKEVNTGWLNLRNNDVILPGKFYFTHSFGFEEKSIQESGVSDYLLIEDANIVSAFQVKNIIGMQFHPEKSLKQGEMFFNNVLKKWKLCLEF